MMCPECGADHRAVHCHQPQQSWVVIAEYDSLIIAKKTSEALRNVGVMSHLGRGDGGRTQVRVTYRDHAARPMFFAGVEVGLACGSFGAGVER